MLSSRRYLSLSLASLGLILNASSDAFAGAPSKAVEPRSAAGIVFGSNVPQKQYVALSKDLVALQSMQLSNRDSKLLSLMNLKDASPASLLGWLQERVHFIVGERFEPTFHVVKPNYDFPNSGLLPPKYAEASGFDGQIAMVMANLGGIYTLSKAKNTLVSVPLPGIGELTFTSPRAGLIQIGEGLFNDQVVGVKGGPEFDNVRRAFRLMALFHEARHSDGNGTSLNFSHMICPEGHAYQGSDACDANLNGAYAIGAHMINSIERSCAQCSLKEHEVLKLQALDNASRIMKETVDPSKDPVAQLKRIQMMVSFCEKVTDLELQSELPPVCAQLAELNAAAAKIAQGGYKIPVVPSTNWDATPEGKFNPKTDLK